MTIDIAIVIGSALGAVLAAVLGLLPWISQRLRGPQNDAERAAAIETIGKILREQDLDGNRVTTLMARRDSLVDTWPTPRPLWQGVRAPIIGWFIAVGLGAIALAGFLSAQGGLDEETRAHMEAVIYWLRIVGWAAVVFGLAVLVAWIVASLVDLAMKTFTSRRSITPGHREHDATP